MGRARAFAPGNISCVFKVVANDDPTRMHSLGMGFTVREGVEVEVVESGAAKVLVNGESIDFPTVSTVVSMLGEGPLEIRIETSLPFSCGFGLSGASALATAYAVDAFLGLGMEKIELAMAAHVAEVENLTGLGDVCAQYHGGCLAKLRPGHPLAAIQLAVQERPIHYQYYSPISTAGILRDPERRQRINRAGDQALAAIGRLVRLKQVEFERCIRLSKDFAVDSGLMADDQVIAAVAEVEAGGGAASMIMLGNAVYSSMPFAGARQTRLSRRPAEVLP